MDYIQEILVIEIVDRASFGLWVQDKPYDVCMAVSLRAALRAFPLTALPLAQRSGIIDFTMPAKRALLTALSNLESEKSWMRIVAGEIQKSFPQSEAKRYGDAIVENADADAQIFHRSATLSALNALNIRNDYRENTISIVVNAASAIELHAWKPTREEMGRTFWAAINRDAHIVDEGTAVSWFAHMSLWFDITLDNNPWKRAKEALEADEIDQSFWIDWYERILEGRPLNWDMIEEIALIGSEDWNKGAMSVNTLIAEIQAKYEDTSAKEPASKKNISTEIISCAISNRDAIVLSVAGLNAQIGEFKDKVHGINHLEPKTRENLLNFLNELTDKLSNLSAALPVSVENEEESDKSKLQQNLIEYLHLVKTEGGKYFTKENLAEATVPTGIIMGCTAIGAMVGIPVAGSIVGGMITGQLKPGKVAEAIYGPKIEGD